MWADNDPLYPEEGLRTSPDPAHCFQHPEISLKLVIKNANVQKSRIKNADVLKHCKSRAQHPEIKF